MDLVDAQATQIALSQALKAHRYALFGEGRWEHEGRPLDFKFKLYVLDWERFRFSLRGFMESHLEVVGAMGRIRIFDPKAKRLRERALAEEVSWPSHLHTLFLGLWRSSRKQSEGFSPLLRLRREGPQGIVRQTEFDRRTLLPAWDRYLDGKGDTAFEVRYPLDGYRQGPEGGWWPARFVVLEPEGRQKITFRINRMVVNEPLPDKVFELELPREGVIRE
jgi:hypothetical protein